MSEVNKRWVSVQSRATTESPETGTPPDSGDSSDSHLLVAFEQHRALIIRGNTCQSRQMKGDLLERFQVEAGDLHIFGEQKADTGGLIPGIHDGKGSTQRTLPDDQDAGLLRPGRGRYSRNRNRFAPSRFAHKKVHAARQRSIGQGKSPALKTVVFRIERETARFAAVQLYGKIAGRASVDHDRLGLPVRIEKSKSSPRRLVRKVVEVKARCQSQIPENSRDDLSVILEPGEEQLEELPVLNARDEDLAPLVFAPGGSQHSEQSHLSASESPLRDFP